MWTGIFISQGNGKLSQPCEIESILCSWRVKPIGAQSKWWKVAVTTLMTKRQCWLKYVKRLPGNEKSIWVKILCMYWVGMCMCVVRQQGKNLEYVTDKGRCPRVASQGWQGTLQSLTDNTSKVTNESTGSWKTACT